MAACPRSGVVPVAAAAALLLFANALVRGAREWRHVADLVAAQRFGGTAVDIGGEGEEAEALRRAGARDAKGRVLLARLHDDGEIRWIMAQREKGDIWHCRTVDLS
jgi:hypothetical protein